MTELEALQQALAEEHRALYTVALAGGRASALKAEPLQLALDAAYADHRERRSWLEGHISELGAAPVAAELTYPVAGDVIGARQIRAAVAAVEKRCVTAYVELVGVTAAGSSLRRAAVTAQAEAAVRSAAFGAPLPPLPGLVS